MTIYRPALRPILLGYQLKIDWKSEAYIHHRKHPSRVTYHNPLLLFYAQHIKKQKQFAYVMALN